MSESSRRIRADLRSHALVTQTFVAKLDRDRAVQAQIDLESRAGARQTGGGTDEDG